MPILAIDYGEKHLGLAFSPDEKVSYTLSTIQKEEVHERIKTVKKVCDEYDIDKILIGLALTQEGKLSSQAKKGEKFGKELKQALGLKIEFWNETLTSVEALKKILESKVPRGKRKEFKHSFAAQIILQEYLDANQSQMLNDEPDLHD